METEDKLLDFTTILTTETHHLQDTLRYCFEKDLKEGDVVLVAGQDKSYLRIRSCVLAAASPFFSSLLSGHYSVCLDDDILVLFPDLDLEQLMDFVRYIYGMEEIKIQENHFLFSFLNFRQTKLIGSDDPDKKLDFDFDDLDDVDDLEAKKDVDMEDAEELQEFDPTQDPTELKTKNVKRLLIESPARISFFPPSTASTSINSSFQQVYIDGELMPFLRCRGRNGECQALFKLPRNDKRNLALTKHLKSHRKEENITEDKENRRDERKQDDECRTLDPGLIEKLKSELCVPLQKTRSKASAEEGVSKLALEQLIQSGSTRVGYERSVTHSTVWTRFYKILLDEVEVPFVSCIQCGKIYTHDRSLGTSSLLRHVCSLPDENKKNEKILSKPLVQELINTKSVRVCLEDLEAKYEKKLKDVGSIYFRVHVDAIPTEYICCRHCEKVYIMSGTRTHINLVRKIEMHDCYIKHARHANMNLQDPQDEKDLKIILLLEPSRIQRLEKVAQEPNLTYFSLDGTRTNYTHCKKCLKFIPISALNFNDERLHRCHKLKSTDHRIRAQGKRKTDCDKCSQTFNSEHFLEIHRRRDHGEGSETVMCSYCAKDFPTERLAKKHELSIHHPEISKKFKCPQKNCGKAFHDSSKLRLHAQTHSSGEKPYVCDQCGKGFNWIGSFQDHRDMHEGNRKFACDFCNKRFTKRNTLNNHRRLHTGERPFLCPAQGCGLTFVQRTACKSHARKKHGINITVYTRNPAVPRSAASLAQMEHIQLSAEMEPTEKDEVKYILNTTGARLVNEHIEHIEILHPGQYISKLQGQTVQIAQLPQGQYVQIIHPMQAQIHHESEGSCVDKSQPSPKHR